MTSQQRSLSVKRNAFGSSGSTANQLPSSLTKLCDRMLTNATKNERSFAAQGAFGSEQPSRIKSPVNVTVLERFAPEVTEFENIDEFKEYLAENEEDMNKLSTVKLNRQFKITGYRITKLQGKISLRKITNTTPSAQAPMERSEHNACNPALMERVNEVNDNVLELMEKFDYFLQLLTQN